MRYHYAPVTADGVVQDFWVPVSVPNLDDQEVDGTTCEQVRVVVYETQERLVAAACEYNGTTPEELGDVGGLCQCVAGPQVLCEDDDPPRAEVRLYLGNLRRTTLLHELIHASQAVYRWQFLAGAPQNPWAIDNEDYAYMLESLYGGAERIVRWGTSLHPQGPDHTYWDEVEG